jgi:hypothetical protein
VHRENRDGTTAEMSCPTAIAALTNIYSYFPIDLANVDAFLLYKLVKRGIDYKDQICFHLHLARQLIGCYSLQKWRGYPISFLGNKEQVSEEARLGNHMPAMREMYRCCQLCSNKVMENHTKYMGKGCVEPRLLKFLTK